MTDTVTSAGPQSYLSHKDEIAQRMTGLAERQTRLSGFEDADTRELVSLLNALREKKLPSLAPLLPILFQLKGRPYRLHDHFPFEPIFRTRMAPELLLMAGRQVAKSSSMASQGIIQAVSVPHFSTLFVTPLFEMVRRFSQNYIKELIDNSVCRRLLTASSTTQNVLQRSFINGSMMHFSYAFLDADRTRGLSVAKVVIDESLYLYTPLVVTSETGTTVKFIVDVTPGESVLSFDNRGRLVWRKIKAKMYHGHRACFRLTTRSGRAIVATAESYLATDRGWRTVSQIIDAVASREDGSGQVTQKTDADNTNTAATPASSRHSARRQLDGRNQQRCKVSRATRLGASGIQLDQVHDLICVREHAAREKEERRLRRILERVQYDQCSGLRLLISPALSWGAEDHHTVAARRDRRSRLVGDGSLVDSRRRRPGQEERGWRLPDTEYPGLPLSRSTTAGALVEEARRVLYGFAGSQEIDWCSLLGRPLFDKGDDSAGRKSGAVHAAADVLQGYVVHEIRDGGLLVLRENFQAQEQSATVRGDTGSISDPVVLRPRSVLEEAHATGLSGEAERPNVSGADQRQAATGLRCGSGRFTAIQPRKRKALSRAQTGKVPADPQTIAEAQTFAAQKAHLDLSEVSLAATSRRARPENAVLRKVPTRGACCNRATIRSSQESCKAKSQRCRNNAVPDMREAGSGKPGPRAQAGTVQQDLPAASGQPTAPAENASEACLVVDDLVSIEFAGFHDVYDIEVEGTHTLLANGIAVSNCQDLNYDFLPVIFETMSASPWKLKQYGGTPKSLDNTLARLHQDSSQAEWVIRCQRGGCNHFNVPAITHDLFDMIGKLRDDISEKEPGLVCAKCGKPLNSRLGRWVHAYPEKRFTFPGYHIPQIVMPMHYADKAAWTVLLNKMAGHGNMTRAQFLNEVCGVASDEGAKLVSLSDIKAAACLPWKNDWREAQKKVNNYRFRVLSVDWGGGGGRLRASAGRGLKEDKRLRSSFTTLAVLGLKANGVVDCLWGYRSLRTHDYEWEARLCLETLAKFRCSHLVHDYSNAGAAREVLIRQAGWPLANIMAVRYHGAASHGAISSHPATESHPRHWYSLDRSYTLLLTCQALKNGIIRFFQDDYESSDNPGVLRDFLALIEEKVDSRVGTDIFTIQRNPNMPDDFAHSVNYGACALWYMANDWPDLASAARMKINPEVLAQLHPLTPVNWDAI